MANLFESALFAANRLIHAHIIATEDPRACFLAREMLDPFVVMDIRLKRGLTQGRTSLLFIHPNWHVNAPDPEWDPSVYEDLLNRSFWTEGTNHPVDHYRLWWVRAKRAREVQGDYEQAVLCLQTAAEALLWAVTSLMLVEDGVSSAQLEVEFHRKQDLAQLVAKLQKRLGGNWDGKGAGDFGTYWRKTYGLRNRITHKAQRVSEDEVDEAFEGFLALRRHVETRVLATQTKNPRVAFGLFSAHGLREMGQLSNKMNQHLKRISGEDQPFWAPFDARISPDCEPDPIPGET